MSKHSHTERIHTARRKFIKTIALGSGAAILTGIPLASHFIAPSLKKSTGKWVDFGSVEDLKTGHMEMLTYEFMVKDGWLVLPKRGFVWAYRNSDHKIKTFSSTCTHLACNVIWYEESGHFLCPCHSGRFNSNGEPIGGPPTKPLLVLDNKIEEDNLLVYLTF